MAEKQNEQNMTPIGWGIERIPSVEAGIPIACEGGHEGYLG